MILGVFLYPLLVFAQMDPPPLRVLISDEDMTNSSAMTLSDIESFLRWRGTLGSYRTTDTDGVVRSAAEIIYRHAQENQLNPQFLLALLQREQSLVEDPSPSQRQYDWALGFAMCDSCSASDTRVSPYKGFAAQIEGAAVTIRKGYLTELALNGATRSGLAPGRLATIDGTPIIPGNQATAVLYTYTPHLHGNENFVRIYGRWFHPDYPDGTLLQALDDGSVWLIHHDLKRRINSMTVLYSRFGAQPMLSTTLVALRDFPTGVDVTYPNFSLLRTPDGAIYLLTDDILRPIPSLEIFRSLGFKDDDVTDVGANEIAPLGRGTSVSADEAFPTGFSEGTLIGITGDPAVYVISDKTRRHIADEGTFLSMGWNWNQIIWTTPEQVLAYPLGDSLRVLLEDPRKGI